MDTIYRRRQRSSLLERAFANLVKRLPEPVDPALRIDLIRNPGIDFRRT